MYHISEQGVQMYHISEQGVQMYHISEQWFRCIISVSRGSDVSYQ